MPPDSDMSIAALPSMRPTTPRSTCFRASATRAGVIASRSSHTSSTIMIEPPMNSARTNWRPSSTQRMTPGSSTRFVEADWNVIAAMKSAPLRKSDRASATAAYEQEGDATPRVLARRMVRGRLSGKRRLISSLVTTACATPDNAKPSTSAQRISQPMIKAFPRVAPIAFKRAPVQAVPSSPGMLFIFIL